MDITASYTIKALDENVDLSDLQEEENSVLSYLDYDDETNILSEDELYVVSMEDVLNHVKEIAKSLSGIDFIMEGSIVTYSADPTETIFNITVKDNTISSKNTLEFEYIDVTAFGSYDNFIDFIEYQNEDLVEWEKPVLDNPFSEEEYDSLTCGEYFFTNNGYGEIIPKSQLQWEYKEVNLSKESEVLEEDDQISKIQFTCDNAISKTALTYFEEIFYKEWSLLIEKTKKTFLDCNTDYKPLKCVISDQGFEALIKPLCVPYGDSYCDPEDDDPLVTALHLLLSEYPDISYEGHIEYYISTVVCLNGEVKPSGGMCEEYDLSSNAC